DMHAPYQRTLPANAKLNLWLRILERGSSGYHSIETLFQRLALHDLVHMSMTDAARTLECSGPAVPHDGIGQPADNIAWRAAAQYSAASGWDIGWHIEIEKRIPVGGGLGGGSADAAAVLRAMDAMCPSPLGAGATMELASSIGADIPFLLGDTSRALAWGRGDRFLALQALPEMAVTLVSFEYGVDTGQAYAAFAERRTEQARMPGGAQYDVEELMSWERVAPLAFNDFESVVSSQHDGVREVLPMVQDEAARLRAAGIAAIGGMTGSGATCFVLHPTDVTIALCPAVGVVKHTTTA
ncbi:MAG: hypothetical protein ABIW79_02060, partial [Gemmatimonas sp.]